MTEHHFSDITALSSDEIDKIDGGILPAVRLIWRARELFVAVSDISYAAGEWLGSH